MGGDVRNNLPGEPTVRADSASAPRGSGNVPPSAPENDAARLSAIIRHAPVGVVQVDNDELVTLWNPAAERIFGWTADEVLGKSLPFIPEDKREEAEALHQNDLRGEVQVGLVLTRCRKDGSLIDILLSSAPVYGADGSVQGSMAAIIDVTEQNRALMALRQEQEFSSYLTLCPSSSWPSMLGEEPCG